MILTCPNCATQYVVKDGAIPPEGRQVRCAACKHSWHQDPEMSEISEPVAQPTDVPANKTPREIGDEQPVTASTDRPEADETVAEATLIEPRSGPEAEERAYEGAVIEGIGEPPAGSAGIARESEPRGEDTAQSETERAEWAQTAPDDGAHDTFSPFADDEQQVAGRRRGIGILVLLLVIMAAAAAFWILAPADLKAKLGLESAGSSPLQLVTTHMDRQHLESGNDLLTLSGRVINPSAREQVVPPIQAQLKNRRGKVVYSWTIQLSAQSLPAGGSASFNSAEVSVPPDGDELTITLGDGKPAGA